jgi:hypothetical protein
MKSNNIYYSKKPQYILSLFQNPPVLETKIEQLNSDMDTVLQVIPKIEDSFLKGDSLLQEKTGNLGLEVRD